jgi:anti-sigma B factor antagonist
VSELKVIELSEGLTHVALSGRFDVQGVQAVEPTLTSHTATRQRPAIVELSEVEFIGSLGIGMLISAARALRKHGVGLVLLSPSARVYEVLRATKTDAIIPIASDREQAIRLLNVGS